MEVTDFVLAEPSCSFSSEDLVNVTHRQKRSLLPFWKSVVFVPEPIFKIYILSLPIVVETDALDFVIGVYLI